MSWTVNQGPCGCCGADCTCPTVECSHCESGLAAQILSQIFDAPIVWSDFAGGQHVKLDASIIAPDILQATSECEWFVSAESATDNPPPGLDWRWVRFYFDSGSTSWRIDIDWWDNVTYTPTDHLITYELDAYECCGTDFTSAITRVAGPSGGLTIISEPTEIEIRGCGCCGPIQTDCCVDPIPDVIFATIDSGCALIDGLVIEMPYLGHGVWSGSEDLDCTNCTSITAKVTCSGSTLTYEISYSAGCVSTGIPMCSNDFTFDCETMTATATYCLATLLSEPGDILCCTSGGTPSTIIFAA